MSRTGALVEAAVIPELGALVQLVRGTLIIHGLVIWSSSGRCGLKFSGCVDVEQWRACPSNAQQQRVDEVVRLVKAGVVPLPVASLAEQCKTGDISREELPDDLRRVSELLDALGEALASDPDVLARHGTALQNLDIAAQVLATVKEAITGQGDWTNDAVKLAGLRRSADQALATRA